MGRDFSLTFSYQRISVDFTQVLLKLLDENTFNTNKIAVSPWNILVDMCTILWITFGAGIEI